MAKQFENILLLCDMDGVVVDFYGGLRKAWMDEFGEDPGEPTHFEIEESYPKLNKEKLHEIWRKKDFFLNLKPMPGALEAIEAMERCHIDVAFCSKPANPQSYLEKAEWIEHYFGHEWLDRLILAKDKTLVHGDYLLDDKPDVFGYNTPTWEHVVFNGQYNDQEREKFCMNWYDWPRLLLYHGSGR